MCCMYLYSKRENEIAECSHSTWYLKRIPVEIPLKLCFNRVAPRRWSKCTIFSMKLFYWSHLPFTAWVQHTQSLLATKERYMAVKHRIFYVLNTHKIVRFVETKFRLRRSRVHTIARFPSICFTYFVKIQKKNSKKTDIHNMGAVSVTIWVASLISHPLSTSISLSLLVALPLPLSPSVSLYLNLSLPLPDSSNPLHLVLVHGLRLDWVSSMQKICSVIEMSKHLPDYLETFHPCQLHSLALLLCQLVHPQVPFLVHVR